MSTHSSTRTLAGYGASPLESNSRPASPTHNAPKHRRDSTAPLMHTPPIGGGSSMSAMTNIASNNQYIKHTATSLGDLQSSGLYRRRKKNEEDTEDEDEDIEEDPDRELNTSDEEEDSSDNDSTVADNEEDDRVTLLTNYNNNNNNNNNDIRIGGMDRNNWRQILVLEEDFEISIQGYRYDTLQYLLYRVSCILSLGLVWLICRWVPKWWVAWVGESATLDKAQWLVFIVSS